MTDCLDRRSDEVPSGRYAYLAPFLKQAKRIAWGELKAMVQPLVLVGGATVLEGDLIVRFANSATIELFGADNPDALRGTGFDGIVVDEVAEIKPELWTDVIRPCLADRKGWALFIGTPHGINLFSELYNMALRTENWRAATWDVHSTSALHPDEIKAMLAEVDAGIMSEASWRREMLCDFTAAGDDQLISVADAYAAADRVYRQDDINHAARVIGVDPARFGDDRSVIVKRQGLQMFTPLIYAGIDNMQLAAAVAAQIQDWQPQAVFIDQGAGVGVIDRLRQLGHQVVEVPFGGKAGKPHLYKNRRTEMWVTMRDWLHEGGAIPHDRALLQELATPTYTYEPSGQMALEPKDKIKERLPGAGSPDIADALALTFASPVHPAKRAVGVRKREYGDINRYDPYAGV